MSTSAWSTLQAKCKSALNQQSFAQGIARRCAARRLGERLRRPRLSPLQLPSPADSPLSAPRSKRVEAQLTDLEAKMESKKMELVHLQTQFQQKSQSDAEASGVPPTAPGVAAAAV